MVRRAIPRLGLRDGRIARSCSCRHVRGHTDGAGRQYFNRADDAAARKAMRLAKKTSGALQ